MKLFQHAAARRRLIGTAEGGNYTGLFQHAAARRRLSDGVDFSNVKALVSTRSRPKAAENLSAGTMARKACFNTQPPEGG